MERCRIAPRPNLPGASVISPSANHFESQTANIDMKYYQIFCDIAEAFFPLTMLLQGVLFGYVMADDFNEWLRQRREKKKAAKQKNFPGHEGSENNKEQKGNP